jgi:hypothetical protein
MSDDQKKSDDSTAFTIHFDPTQGSKGDVPSIDDLLSSRSRKKTTSGGKTQFIQNSSLKNLKAFGNQIEIHFLLDHDHYRYIQHNDHSKRAFFGLDELFQEMKIPQKFMQSCGTFGEFKKSEHLYLFEAFGMESMQYLQFVSHQNSKIVTVYASESSMLSQKDQVILYTESTNRNLSASGMDLDVA